MVRRAILFVFAGVIVLGVTWRVLHLCLHDNRPTPNAFANADIATFNRYATLEQYSDAESARLARVERDERTRLDRELARLRLVDRGETGAARAVTESSDVIVHARAGFPLQWLTLIVVDDRHPYAQTISVAEYARGMLLKPKDLWLGVRINYAALVASLAMVYGVLYVLWFVISLFIGFNRWNCRVCERCKYPVAAGAVACPECGRGYVGSMRELGRRRVREALFRA